MEFARNEMFWATFIFIPLLFLAAVVWVLMAAVQFVAEMRRKGMDKVGKTKSR